MSNSNEQQALLAGNGLEEEEEENQIPYSGINFPAIFNSLQSNGIQEINLPDSVEIEGNLDLINLKEPASLPLPGNKENEGLAMFMPYDIFPQINFKRKRVTIDNYDNDLFVVTNDFNSDQILEDEEIMVKVTLVTSLYDEVTTLIKKDELTEEEKADESFKIYLARCEEAVQYIIGLMLENSNWMFNPMEKFIWIYLMFACYYEVRAIKYVQNSRYFSEKMITMPDRKGMFPLLICCQADDASTLMNLNLNHYLKSEMFSKVFGATSLPTIIHAIHKTDIFAYIIENIPDIEPVIKNKYINNVTPFLYSCRYNPDIACFLLQSGLIGPEEFMCSLGDSQMTCLMLATFQSNLLLELLASEICSQELINMTSPHYGNILNIAAAFNKPLIGNILNSNYMNKGLLKGMIKNLENVSFNILFELYDDNENLKKVLDSNLLDEELLSQKIKGETIVSLLARKNPEGLKIILNSPFCSKDLLQIKSDAGLTPLIQLALSHPSEIDMIIGHKIFEESSLFDTDLKGRNVLMILIKNKKISEKSLDMFLTNEILFQKDKTHEMNTFCYLCIYDPEYVKKLLSEKQLDIRRCISDIGVDGSCMLVDIVIESNSYDLLEKLLNSDFCSSEILGNRDKNGNNILTLIEKNPTKLNLLLNCRYMTQEIMISTNKKGSNVLYYFLEFNKLHEDWIEQSVKSIISHKFANTTLINQINDKQETPFLYSCNFGITVCKLISESSFFYERCFSKVDNDGNNCLINACFSKDVALLKFLGHHPLMRADIFNQRNKASCSIVYYALDNNNLEMIDYILNHKLCDRTVAIPDIKIWLKEIIFNTNVEKIKILLKYGYGIEEVLLSKDEKGRNLLMNSIMHDPDFFELLLEMEEINEKILLEVDGDGNNFLQLVDLERENLDILRYILDNKNFSNKLLTNKNNTGNCFLHQLAKKNKTSELNLFLQSSFCNKSDLLLINSDGFNLITLACQLNQTDIILNLPYITSEILATADLNHKTCLHYIATSDELNDVISEDFQLILNSKLCTSELLEKQDANGNNFLLINPKYLDNLLQYPLITTKLLEQENDKGINLLMVLSAFSILKIPAFLKNEKVTQKIFQISETTNLNVLMISMNINNHSLPMILNSTKCDNGIVNLTNKYGLTALSYGIIKDCYKNVKLLLNSSFDLSPSFKNKNGEKRNVLMLAAIFSFKIFKLIINSKYMNTTFLFEFDDYGKNVISFIFSSNLEMVKLLMDNERFRKVIIEYRDRNGNSILSSVATTQTKNAENADNTGTSILDYLLENSCEDGELLSSLDNLGRSCLHQYILEKKHLMLERILNSNYFNENILFQKDVFGKTCLHYACEKREIDSTSFETIYNSKFFSCELIKIQDNQGRNVIMYSIENYQNSIASKMIKSDCFSKEILFQKDNQGQTIFTYAVKFSISLLKLLIRLGYCTQELVTQRDQNYYNSLGISCKYKGRAIKYLLELEFVQNDDLHFNHSDHGSCLTIAAKLQPEAVEHILDWPKLDPDIFYKFENNLDFLRIGCIFNAEVVRYAIESKHDMRPFIENKGEPAIMLAAKHQPEAVKYLLNGKYGKKEMLTLRKNERSCIDDAFDFQPRALLHMIESKYCTEDVLKQEDDIGYKLIHKIRQAYSDVLDINDIKKINLIEFKNDLAEEEDQNVCKICYTYRNKIAFTPCFHLACVGCAFKLLKCHECRSLIEYKKNLYF